MPSLAGCQRHSETSNVDSVTPGGKLKGREIGKDC